MNTVSMFGPLSQRAGENPTHTPPLIEDWLTKPHISSIQNYFEGRDSLESAQAAWRILLSEDYCADDLSKKIGKPLKDLYLMEQAK